jgi:hypothetical protein
VTRFSVINGLLVLGLLGLITVGALSLIVPPRRVTEGPQGPRTPAAVLTDVHAGPGYPVSRNEVPVESAPSSGPVRGVPAERHLLAAALTADCGASCRARRLEAIEHVVAARSVDAIALLGSVDIASDGYVAAAAIRALGDLATTAPKAERGVAVGTLASWLTKSQALGEAGYGNVSLIVDALADSGALDAVAPLSRALDSEHLPLHLETRTVQALTAIGDPSSIGAVQRFGDRLDVMGAGPTPFDVELRAEARGAVLAYLATVAPAAR